MKLTIETMIKANAIISQITSEQVSAKLYYRLAKMSRKLQKTVEAYEDTRKALVVKHAKKKDGQPVIKNDSYVLNNESKFKLEIRDILESEEEVDIEKIPSEFLEELRLPAGEMAWLLELIETK